MIQHELCHIGSHQRDWSVAICTSGVVNAGTHARRAADQTHRSRRGRLEAVFRPINLPGSAASLSGPHQPTFIIAPSLPVSDERDADSAERAVVSVDYVASRDVDGPRERAGKNDLAALGDGSASGQPTSGGQSAYDRVGWDEAKRMNEDKDATDKPRCV